MTAPPAASPEPLPAERRPVIAALAAAWVRERGTLPPSIEVLVEWGAGDTGVELEAELAFLEGRGPDPCSPSGYLRPVHADEIDEPERARLHEALRESAEQMRSGQTLDASEALAELRAHR